MAGLQYREIASGWRLEQDEKGVTGTRVFIYDPDDVSLGAKKDLPNIGDNMFLGVPISTIGSTTAPTEVLCRKRSFEFLGGDSRKWQWTCLYSNEPTDPAQYDDGTGATPPTDANLLPIRIDYAGEFQMWNPPTDANGLANTKWVWDGTTDKVLQPIPYRVRSNNMSITRIIAGGNYVAWMQMANQKLGHVNSDDYITLTSSGGGRGIACWLFTNISTEMYRNHFDKKAWSVTMTFTYRDPNGSNLDGWNMILSKEGDWKMPYNNSTSSRIYPETEFKPLFT